MLKGIDISNWEADCLPGNLPIDFVICKATEGLTYVSPSCDKQIQSAIKGGKLFGFYHFARNNDPIKEADFFIKKCLGYFNKGIPVLDWEDGQSVEWVNKFVRRVKEVKGIWCWIYANPWRFNQGGVEKNCDRWIAAYGKNNPVTLDTDPGNVPKTDGTVCCWQYGDKGRVPGYSGNLDVNHFYGDKKAWEAYAGVKTSESSLDKTSTLENDEYKVTIERK
jgi:GH25 family lysozyme M1 (1,4-beta-N-acetylmuramidase)